MNPKPAATTRQSRLLNVSENFYRRESSGVYYAVAKRGRKYYHRSLKTKDASLGRARLRDFLTELDSLVSHDAGKLTFEIVAERWEASDGHTLKDSTALRRKHYLAGIMPFFRGLTLRNITKGDCEAWLTKRGASIAAETFNHELGVMKAIFDYAKDQGWLLRNPAQSIKRKRVVVDDVIVPTLAQFEQLVATIRQSDGRRESQAAAKDGADLVELLAYSGCRVDEARQLRWKDVAWPFGERQGTLRVTGGKRRTKNYEARTVPMTDSLFGLLSRIHTERQPKPDDTIVRIHSAKKCLATACRKLGFHRFTHHAFRHFFMTTCIESGIDAFTFSKWVGHKDGGALALKRYAHLRQEHSFAQIKRVNFKPASNVVTLNQTATTSPAVHIDAPATTTTTHAAV